MPKRIPELKERILTNARQALLSGGYSALSVRLLAQQCGVAPGTIYNYFSSKDALVACIMLQDWEQCLAQMKAFSATPQPLEEGFAGLCTCLEGYIAKYRPAWRQYDSPNGSGSYAEKYHRVLREQISAPLAEVLLHAGQERLLPLVPLLAETMLACAREADLSSEQFRLLASSWISGGIAANTSPKPLKEEKNHEQLSRSADS